CGLVYSTLAFASAGGTAMHGFVVMRGFGIGTLPAMISVGSLSQQLKYYLNHHLFRYGSGLLLALFAGQTFYIAVKQLMMSAPMH
ncbi:MAG TPA: sulfite exporter TauE/SafE family protein, partial [Psychromonas hadalis]|nr:sulfite exporter TauE/SafE family protein [Psychromonas hadalis]